MPDWIHGRLATHTFERKVPYFPGYAIFQGQALKILLLKPRQCANKHAKKQTGLVIWIFKCPQRQATVSSLTYWKMHALC